MPDDAPTVEDERAETLSMMILRGYTRKEVTRWIRDETDWKLSKAKANDLIDCAFELIKDPKSVDMQAAWHAAHDRLLGLIRRAGDMARNATTNSERESAMRLELAAEKELSQLLGLNKQAEKEGGGGVVNINLLQLPDTNLNQQIVARHIRAQNEFDLLDQAIEAAGDE